MSSKDLDFWNLIKKTIIKKNNIILFKIKIFLLCILINYINKQLLKKLIIKKLKYKIFLILIYKL